MEMGEFRKTWAKPSVKKPWSSNGQSPGHITILLIFILRNMRPPWFCIREQSRNREGISASSLYHSLLDGPGQKRQGQNQQFQREKKRAILSRSGKAKTHRDIVRQSWWKSAQWDWTKGRKISSQQDRQKPSRTSRNP